MAGEQPRHAGRNSEIFQWVVVEGRSVAEAAAHFALSPRRVREIVRNRRELLAPGGAPRLEVLRLERMRLEHLWREALRAWRSSADPRETTRAARGPAGERVERELQTRRGDIRILAFARRVLADLRDVEEQIGEAQAGRELPRVEQLTVEQREREFLSLLAEQGELGGTEAGD